MIAAIDPTPLLADTDDGDGGDEDDDDGDDYVSFCSAATNAEKEKKKRGHRVLFCCDTRRAVLLFTIIQFVTNFLGLISITVWENVPFSIFTCILYSVSMVFYFLVLHGAVYYRWREVLLSLGWEIIAIALVIITTAIFDWSSVSDPPDHFYKVAMIVIISGILAWRILVIYSLGMFIIEVRSGVMSAESHDREKYSCCCNV